MRLELKNLSDSELITYLMELVLKAFRNVSEPLIIQMLIAEFMQLGGYSRQQKSLAE
jgi:hypothetical protein